MARRRMMLSLVIAALAACKREEPPPAPAPTDPLVEAPALCAELFGKVKLDLESSCSQYDVAGTAYAYLVRRAETLERDCAATLEPEVKAGRVELRASSLRACAKALSGLGYKRRLALGSIGEVTDCRGLVQGKQPEGQPCAFDASCVEGLYCDSRAAGVLGVCRSLPASGAECPFRTGPHAGWLARSTCASGADACKGTPRRLFPLGFDEIDPDAPRPAGSAASLTPEAFVRRGIDQVVRGESHGDPDMSDPEFGLGPNGPKLSGRGGGIGSAPLGPKMRLVDITAGGGLPVEVVSRIVRQSFGRFRNCYDQALGNDPDLTGSLKITFTIGGQGSVVGVQAVPERGAHLGDGALASCIAQGIGGLSFPSPEAGVVAVDARLDLSPPPPPPAESTRAPAPTCGPVAVAGCADDPDCTDGLRCVAGTCRGAVVAMDQSCDETADCEPAAFCAFSSRATSGLRPLGRCKPLKAVGARCSSSLQCAGYCDADGHCRPLCGAR